MAILQIQTKASRKAAAETAAKAAKTAAARRTPPRKVVLGVIVGNRGFFPGHLAQDGRGEILKALSDEGYEAVLLPAKATNYGAIESRDEAKAYADLFRKNRDRIDG